MSGPPTPRTERGKGLSPGSDGSDHVAADVHLGVAGLPRPREPGLGDTDTFRLLAIALGATLLVTGTLTTFRVANASQEDYMFIKGMNRLRAAYVHIDPTLAPYFITGLSDDRAGVHQTYTMGPKRDLNHVLASASMFVTVVNTLVAGGLAAFVAWPTGGVVAVLVALVAMIVHFALWAPHGRTNYATAADPGWVRFPSTTDVS